MQEDGMKTERNTVVTPSNAVTPSDAETAVPGPAVAGPRVTTPEGVRSLLPRPASRPDPVPSSGELMVSFEDRLPEMGPIGRGAVGALLDAIGNGRYAVMTWVLEGNRITIHRAFDQMPTENFTKMQQQCGETLDYWRRHADAAEIAEKTGRRDNGQSNAPQ